MTLGQLIEAIQAFHSDPTRSPQSTLEGLVLLIEEIEPMIDSLQLIIEEEED